VSKNQAKINVLVKSGPGGRTEGLQNIGGKLKFTAMFRVY